MVFFSRILHQKRMQNMSCQNEKINIRFSKLKINLWISSKSATGLISYCAASNRILDAPPIWSKFKNSDVDTLLKWLEKKDGSKPKLEVI